MFALRGGQAREGGTHLQADSRCVRAAVSGGHRTRHASRVAAGGGVARCEEGKHHRLLQHRLRRGQQRLSRQHQAEYPERDPRSRLHARLEATPTIVAEETTAAAAAKGVSLQESIIEEAKQTVDSMREGVDTSRASSVGMVVPSHVDAHSAIAQESQRNDAGRPQVAPEHRGTGQGRAGESVHHVA